MIGKIVVPLVTAGVPAGYHVVTRKERPAKIVTLSVHDCIMRSIDRRRKARIKAQPQWLRRYSGAYCRGERGVSLRYSVSNPKFFKFHSIGLLGRKLPNL